MKTLREYLKENAPAFYSYIEEGKKIKSAQIKKTEPVKEKTFEEEMDEYNRDLQEKSSWQEL